MHGTWWNWLLWFHTVEIWLLAVVPSVWVATVHVETLTLACTPILLITWLWEWTLLHFTLSAVEDSAQLLSAAAKACPITYKIVFTLKVLLNLVKMQRTLHGWQDWPHIPAHQWWQDWPHIPHISGDKTGLTSHTSVVTRLASHLTHQWCSSYQYYTCELYGYYEYVTLFPKHPALLREGSEYLTKKRSQTLKKHTPVLLSKRYRNVLLNMGVCMKHSIVQLYRRIHVQFCVKLESCAKTTKA